MGIFIELFLIGVGLAMDSFAVSICKGLSMKKFNLKNALIIAFYFGFFQALMPLIGWYVGIELNQYLINFSYIIAFLLLVLIGSKMIYEAKKEKGDEEHTCSKEEKLSHKELLILALSTSIDALAVGFSFALLKTPILKAIVIIGLITFILSIIGVKIGNIYATKYKTKAEILGGIILILIGLKIIIEHFFAA